MQKSSSITPRISITWLSLLRLLPFHHCTPSPPSVECRLFDEKLFSSWLAPQEKNPYGVPKLQRRLLLVSSESKRKALGFHVRIGTDRLVTHQYLFSTPIYPTNRKGFTTSNSSRTAALGLSRYVQLDTAKSMANCGELWTTIQYEFIDVCLSALCNILCNHISTPCSLVHT